MFVGREQELGALRAVSDAASDGPAAALVVGAAGTGKSRLLAEARARIGAPHSLEVVGYEPERQVPFAAVAGLLRTLTEVPDDGARLDALLLGVGEAPTLEPIRLFEAAHRACGRLERVLLVIDDLQWMDDLSLALCHYLIRAAAESGHSLVVLAATRPDEQGAGLVATLPEGRVTRMELRPLSRSEGVELAQTIDPALDQGQAAALWESAEGSPFWLEALARSGASGTAITELLTWRMRGAGADAGSVLGFLAVAGRPVAASDVADVLGWPETRAASALEELERRGLVVDELGSRRLAHDLIRQAALPELSHDARMRLHRSLAEKLERDAGGDFRLLSEALEHRRSSGLPVLDLARRLATSPRRTLLGMSGCRLLAAIVDEADPQAAETMTLHEDVAALAGELGEHEDALSRWKLAAARETDRLRLARCLLAASRSAFELSRLDEARALLARSRAIDPGDGVLALEQDVHEAGILLWLERQTAAGRALARTAVASAASMAGALGGVDHLDEDSRRAYGDALRIEFEAAMQEGDAEALLDAARRWEEAARGSSLENHLAASLAVGTALRLRGQLDEALERYRGVWADSHRHVLPRLGVDTGVALVRTLEQRAELLEAEDLARETREIASRVGDVPRARHRFARADWSVSLERGHLREGLALLEVEVAREPSEHQRIVFHVDAARWHARLEGSAARAYVLEQLGSARACLEAVGCPRCGAELALYSSEALARVDERAEARGALEEWDGRGILDDDLHALVRVHHAALSEDEREARVGELRVALETAKGSPYRLQLLWIQLDLGRALAEAGSADAVPVLEQAVAMARERGAGTVQELAERALRAAGVRTWRRAGAGMPLTGREREVAELVASGATNREIAQTLFLSPKTVERHISNALKKVGARNRTELAERLRGRNGQIAGSAG